MARVEFRHINKTHPDGTRAVIDLNLSVEDREFLCLLGPSGCGKSSTLRVLAGLEPITSGDLFFEGKRINDVPAQARDMAMVFENYALYPHLNVFDNIAMPLVARRTPKPEIRERVRRIAETLGIAEHLPARPHMLSGGQRQRVSLARALVRRPKMFLMDEPLGHLEEYLRVELRREIRALHENVGGTTLYITHDQQEAAAVGDRIAVMSRGALQQVATMSELINRPANRFVAEFVGEPPISIFENVRVSNGRLELGDYAVALPENLAKASHSTVAQSLGVRPEHFSIGSSEAEGLSAIAMSVQPMGAIGAILCETPAGPATALAVSDVLPKEGELIRLRPDQGRLQLFAADGRNLLQAGA
jgi:multiple sugar transport system ATP-binding protein